MIVVEGKILGKQRPHFNRKTGTAYTPSETTTYENWVRLCYQQQGGKHLEGSIRATIIAYYKVPKSYSKKRIGAIRLGAEYPQKKPDIDNCIKIILDSLNGVAYDDDSQIVEVVAMKRWTESSERVEFEFVKIKEGA